MEGRRCSTSITRELIGRTARVSRGWRRSAAEMWPCSVTSPLEPRSQVEIAHPAPSQGRPRRSCRQPAARLHRRVPAHRRPHRGDTRPHLGPRRPRRRHRRPTHTPRPPSMQVWRSVRASGDTQDAQIPAHPTPAITMRRRTPPTPKRTSRHQSRSRIGVDRTQPGLLHLPRHTTRRRQCPARLPRNHHSSRPKPHRVTHARCATASSRSSAPAGYRSNTSPGSSATRTPPPPRPSTVTNSDRSSTRWTGSCHPDIPKAGLEHLRIRPLTCGNDKWSYGDSNPGPLPCHGSALPTAP